jgi:hypothetical protein
MKKIFSLFTTLIFIGFLGEKTLAAEVIKADENKNATKKPQSEPAIINSSDVPPESLGAEDGPTPLNKEVRFDGEDQINKVFRNMVVVQRKAKNKAKHFLFNPIIGLDFSDGPATFYTFNTNFGYALTDFWEVYVNYVPKFLTQERGIVKKISTLESYDKTGKAQQLIINYEKPSAQVGLEIIYAPAYGKESWGPSTIFRSDTFFKFGASQMTFEQNKKGEVKKGMRYAFMLGKTFFIAKYFNTRMDAGFHYMQTFVDGDTKFNPLLFVEAGFVFYF